MQIDWLTVAAQAVNFLILVWLLKRFLYGPVIRAMDKREQRIRERLDSAAKREQAAEDEAERYRSQQQELERTREDALAEARRDAEETRRSMKQSAQEEVDEQRRQWLKALESEQADVLKNLTREVGRQVAHATRKALSDLADAELEAQAVRIFLKRLHALDEDERKAIADTLKGGGEAVVSTTFDLPKKLRGEIESAIAGLLGDEVELRFEQNADLACGVALAVADRRISWSVDQYLAGLEQDLADLVPTPERAE